MVPGISSNKLQGFKRFNHEKIKAEVYKNECPSVGPKVNEGTVKWLGLVLMMEDWDDHRKDVRHGRVAMRHGHRKGLDVPKRGKAAIRAEIQGAATHTLHLGRRVMGFL